MAKVLVNESSLSSIADAIREKLGVSTTYTPAQMGPAIETITGGGGEEVTFDDRNQYVRSFLTASSSYAASNRSSMTVIDSYADKTISDQDAPKPFLGKYNLVPSGTNAIDGWTVTRLPEPPRMLKLENVWNVRDVGGWECDGGTVKFGKVFRGARLNNVSSSSADATALAGFGIKLDLDIRDSGNISEKNGWLASPINPLAVTKLGTGYYKVEVTAKWASYYSAGTHLGLCFAGTSGADLIITVDEPIE